ncbi:MAG: ABC transporter ATP-binding protein [Deltaproteobacteria bacterium]
MGRVSAHGLGKSYKRYPRARDRVLDWLTGGRVRRFEVEVALADVSFEIESGQSVGIIGMNGAGKSTLLRLLTGTSTPTSGTFSVEGRVAALLELGIGIHPDFTGWQNARLSCQLLGLDEETIDRVLPWIEEFSELGGHLDHPVRTYSTGMQVRLAFSSAVAVRPDVLIVDEALSVGDAFFQHRSMGRIREMRDAGTTILFVTHDPSAVKSICDRVLLLDRGRVIHDGTPSAVYDFYNALIAEKESASEIKQLTEADGGVSTRAGSGEATIEGVDIFNAAGEPAKLFTVGQSGRVDIRFRLSEGLEFPTIGFAIRDRLGNDVFGSNTHHLGVAKPLVEAGHTYTASFELEWLLGPGSYSVSVALHSGAAHLDESYDWWDRALVFQVVAGDEPPFTGVVSLPIRARVSGA